jgi:hypothetical protein
MVPPSRPHKPPNQAENDPKEAGSPRKKQSKLAHYSHYGRSKYQNKEKSPATVTIANA